ncbi:MAG: hypothetical protein OXU62_06880 [Gammaproteobacteria bacterium]|nr:hypothetical protein [Gammaproteobacteria bacterium]
MNQQTHRQALPKGYMLQEYQVDRVLGAEAPTAGTATQSARFPSGDTPHPK